MPLIKSAKKRVRTAKKAAVRNSKTKRNLKSSLKLFSKSPSAKTQSSAQSNLDKAVKKGLVHKNKAARQKSRLAARAKAAGVQKTTTKKPATKKAPAKKPPVKKTSTAKKKR
jgi:small subunit ribosomal protein S20